MERKADYHKTPNPTTLLIGICLLIILMICCIVILEVKKQNRKTDDFIYNLTHPQIGDLVLYSNNEWGIVTKITPEGVLTRIVHQEKLSQPVMYWPRPVQIISVTNPGYEAAKKQIVSTGRIKPRISIAF